MDNNKTFIVSGKNFILEISFFIRILLTKRPHKKTNIPPIEEQPNNMEMEIIKLDIHEIPSHVNG